MSSWAKPGTGIQYVNHVTALAVKMVTEMSVEWLMSCNGYYCKVQGLSFISTKVISMGYPALSGYRVDCKHCYGGRPEVCVEVHG